jgi:hypothetical protein
MRPETMRYRDGRVSRTLADLRGLTSSAPSGILAKPSDNQRSRLKQIFESLWKNVLDTVLVCPRSEGLDDVVPYPSWKRIDFSLKSGNA